MGFMTNNIKQITALFACAGLLLISGCFGGNSDLGNVTGTIKVNGEPISNAAVTFMPVEGRASIGLTDAEGRYKMVYTVGQDGARIGKHKVFITTEVVKEPAYGHQSGAADPVRQKGRKELLPKNYSERNYTELTANVESGDNTIDFDLTVEKKK